MSSVPVTIQLFLLCLLTKGSLGIWTSNFWCQNEDECKIGIFDYLIRPGLYDESNKDI